MLLLLLSFTYFLFFICFSVLSFREQEWPLYPHQWYTMIPPTIVLYWFFCDQRRCCVSFDRFHIGFDDNSKIKLKNLRCYYFLYILSLTIDVLRQNSNLYAKDLSKLWVKANHIFMGSNINDINGTLSKCSRSLWLITFGNDIWVKIVTMNATKSISDFRGSQFDFLKNTHKSLRVSCHSILWQHKLCKWISAIELNLVFFSVDNACKSSVHWLLILPSFNSLLMMVLLLLLLLRLLYSPWHKTHLFLLIYAFFRCLCVAKFCMYVYITFHFNPIE